MKLVEELFWTYDILPYCVIEKEASLSFILHLQLLVI